LNRAAALAAALIVSACAPEQLERAQADIEKAQPAVERIERLCKIAVPLAPLAGPVAPWIDGACMVDGAIARIASDPNSVAWMNDLIEKARAHAAARGSK